jgi:hypothetical protein
MHGCQQNQQHAAALLPCSPEWGASTCPPTTPELVLRQDGCMDVRIPAVLAALLDASQGTHTSSSSSTSSSSEHLSEALDVVMRRRCQQLLQEMPTTLQQDQDLQQQQQHRPPGGSDDGGLMSAVLQYRMSKKQLLAYFA